MLRNGQNTEGGEIRWAELNPVRGNEHAGLRPVLILSHDVFNERSGWIELFELRISVTDPDDFGSAAQKTGGRR